MKTVVEWHDTECRHCIRCLKSCPTEAISIVDHSVQIDPDLCISCDVCMKECPSRILKVKGVHMIETLHEHEFNVILIPTSLLSDCKSFEDFQQTCQAIHQLGFDVIEQYSDIEGFLYHKSQIESQEQPGIWLTSFCPTMNQFIKKQYPTLYDRILPYDYPVEIAARRIRKRYEGKDIGIYSLCECVGKMTLAKKPFDNEQSQVDYAITISHVFPKMNRLKTKECYPIQMNKYGVKSNVEDLYGHKSFSVMRVAGFEQAKNLFDLIEFDQIQHVNLVALYACHQGCIGGYYLWSNPFEGCYNIESMIDHCNLPIEYMEEDEYYKQYRYDEKNIQSRKERMMWLQKVNDILDQLPQYDCGACGFANCRGLAQRVANGEVSIEKCRVRKG